MPPALFDPLRPSPRRSNNECDHFLLARAGEDIVDLIGTPPLRCATIGDPGATVLRWFEVHGVTPEPLDPLPLKAGDPDAVLKDPRFHDGVGAYDLVLTLGLFEQCNMPDLAAAVLAGLLAPGGRLVGVTVGGGSLATLRDALLAVDRAEGRAAIRVHPMMDGSGLAGLLAGAGLADPVVNVDRVNVRYSSPHRLVGDLRAMGCSRRLAAPSPPISKRQWHALCRQLAAPFIERFDLLHFHAVKRGA